MCNIHFASKSCAFSYIGRVTVRHMSKWASAKLCGVEQRAPPVFSRAAITLGIGPHSSHYCYSLSIISASLFCAVKAMVASSGADLGVMLDASTEIRAGLCVIDRYAYNNKHTQWTVKRRQLIFVCYVVKNQRILIRFSLIDFKTNVTCDGMNVTHLP